MNPPTPAPSRSVIPFVGFGDGALAVFLCPVGQIIILKRLPKYLLRKDSILSVPYLFKKSTSTLITPYKNFNDHTSAELREGY